MFDVALESLQQALRSLRTAAASLCTIVAPCRPNRRPVCAFVPASHGGVRAGVHKCPRSMWQAVQVDEQDAVLARDVAALSQQALARLHARVHHARSPAVSGRTSAFRVKDPIFELGARGADLCGRVGAYAGESEWSVRCAAVCVVGMRGGFRRVGRRVSLAHSEPSRG